MGEVEERVCCTYARLLQHPSMRCRKGKAWGVLPVIVMRRFCRSNMSRLAGKLSFWCHSSLLHNSLELTKKNTGGSIRIKDH